MWPPSRSNHPARSIIDLDACSRTTFRPQYRQRRCIPAIMNRVWKADWPINSENAKSLIETSFPTLSPASVKPFGVGWDNTVFLVNDAFVFRFPRRRIAAPLMQAEFQILPWLSEQLPLSIPNPCYAGKPSSEYPCVFAGYPFIPGQTVTSTRMTDDERRAMAKPLARFLAALHSVSPEDARNRGASEDPSCRLDPSPHKVRAIDRLASFPSDLLPRSVEARIRLLLDIVPTLEQPSTKTLLHGDLHANQILVTEGTHELAGVIDWGDIHLGDPASDFAVVHSMLPRDCHHDFLTAYGPVDPLRWSAAKARGRLAHNRRGRTSSGCRGTGHHC
jgi:aminoglycoside phosphotransferase (APT) family kinase protein